MPRRERPDLKPEIWMHDYDDDQQNIKRYLKQGRRASVYSDDPAAMHYIFEFAHIDAKYWIELISAASPGTPINSDIFIFLVSKLRPSKVEPVRNSDLSFSTKNGMKKMRLEILGCRSYFYSEQQLAYELGLHRSTISRQFAIMREAGIITNQGHGWVDLNADLVWKGSHAHQMAYVEQYPQPDTISIEPTLVDVSGR